jgi:hypothetical protein
MDSSCAAWSRLFHSMSISRSASAECPRKSRSRAEESSGCVLASVRTFPPTPFAQDDMVSPASQPSGEHSLVHTKSLTRLFDGENLKCFSASPHHCCHESSASSKKSRVGRALEKIEKRVERFLE